MREESIVPIYNLVKKYKKELAPNVYKDFQNSYLKLYKLIMQKEIRQLNEKIKFSDECYKQNK